MHVELRCYTGNGEKPVYCCILWYKIRNACILKCRDFTGRGCSSLLDYYCVGLRLVSRSFRCSPGVPAALGGVQVRPNRVAIGRQNAPGVSHVRKPKTRCLLTMVRKRVPSGVASDERRSLNLHHHQMCFEQGKVMSGSLPHHHLACISSPCTS